jgi:hypothetical protein
VRSSPSTPTATGRISLVSDPNEPPPPNPAGIVNFEQRRASAPFHFTTETEPAIADLMRIGSAAPAA